MADEIKFCYKCGAALPDGADFCPECGMSVRGDGEARAPVSAAASTSEKRNGLGAVPVLILIYGVFALIVAVFAFMTGALFDTMLDMLKSYAEQGIISQEEYQNLINMIGATSDSAIASLKIRFALEGVAFAVSGIAALVSSHYCGKLENYQRAFMLCIVASACTVLIVFLGDFTGLFLAVVGFVMCYLIYQGKEKFSS